MNRASVEQKSVFTDNLGQKIWKKVKKSRKIEQHQKTKKFDFGDTDCALGTAFIHF